MRFLSLLSPSDVSVVVGWCCDLCSVMLMLCTAKREREREKISEDPDSFLSEPGNLTLRIIPTSQRVVRPFSFDVNRSLSQRPSRSAVLVHRLLIIIDCVVLVCHSKERNEAASTMTDEKLYITNAEKVRGLFAPDGWLSAAGLPPGQQGAGGR